jgi:hypothetical protein
MKVLLILPLTIVLCACTSAPVSPMGPPPGEAIQVEQVKSWFCHAISKGHETRAHGEGHGASCEGTEECARRKALADCGRYHNDCEVVFCTD